jgi:TusA-related sulfurtransferase
MTEIPPGDAILICCESVAADKQYRVWKKWFAKHEDLEVSAIDASKSILIYRPIYVE